MRKNINRKVIEVQLQAQPNCKTMGSNNLITIKERAIGFIFLKEEKWENMKVRPIFCLPTIL